MEIGSSTRLADPKIFEVIVRRPLDLLSRLGPGVKLAGIVRRSSSRRGAEASPATTLCFTNHRSGVRSISLESTIMMEVAFNEIT